MTEAEAKAELRRRFVALMAEETEQMRGGGASKSLIDAFVAENLRRFEAALPHAIAKVCGEPAGRDCGVFNLATAKPKGRA